MNKLNYEKLSDLQINTTQIHDLLTTISDVLDNNKPTTDKDEHNNDVLTAYSYRRIIPMLNTLINIIFEINDHNDNILTTKEG